jgi:hypothetical protein
MVRKQCSFKFLLEVPFQFPYTERMKNNAMSRLRAQEINYMNEDDKSMHIFYTLEEIEQLVATLHKKLDVNDPTLGQKIASLEDVVTTLDRLVSRCEVSAKFIATPIINK